MPEARIIHTWRRDGLTYRLVSDITKAPAGHKGVWLVVEVCNDHGVWVPAPRPFVRMAEAIEQLLEVCQHVTFATLPPLLEQTGPAVAEAIRRAAEGLKEGEVCDIVQRPGEGGAA